MELPLITLCLLVGSEGLQGVSSNSLETTTRNSDWSSLLYEYWDPMFTSCGMHEQRALLSITKQQ